jgi:hypothetical protein
MVVAFAPIPVIRVPTIRRLKSTPITGRSRSHEQRVVTTRKQTFAPDFCARRVAVLPAATPCTVAGERGRENILAVARHAPLL